MKSISFLAAAAFIGIGATPTIAVAVPVDGDPVLYWAETLSRNQAGSPLPGSRGVAMVSVALHDAVNATMGNVNHGYLDGVPTFGGDTRAAASVAAHNVLVNIFAADPVKVAQFGVALQAQLDLIADGPAKANGIATGAAVASAVILKRTGDGSAAVVPYTPQPPGTIGRWQPTPPAGAPFAFTQWGSQDTWVIDSGDQFRPVAPPTVDSAEYTAAFNQVKEIGSLTSATRTEDQTKAAQFWATATGNPMLRLALALAEGGGLSTLENAQLFARLSTTMVDSGIATWDAKLHYDYWRPVTGIRMGEFDGNADTLGDDLWSPLINTPPYPAYTSGLVGLMGSGAHVLEMSFGDVGSMCVQHGHDPNPALDRCFDNFDAMVHEIVYNRIWAGIHWEFDQLAALTLAQTIAQFVLDSQAFDRIPEPAILSLFGLGVAGLIVGRERRRRKLAA